MENINLLEIEKESNRLLDDITNIRVELPVSVQEFESRFSLSNDEVNIDSVDFKEPDIEDLFSIRIELPVSMKEFQARFL